MNTLEYERIQDLGFFGHEYKKQHCGLQSHSHRDPSRTL